MNPQILKINEEISDLKSQVVNHRVYTQINSLQDLCIFMEHHIYAVWDFMSLLKALQIKLTCTTLPWFPVGNPVTRKLINEIVAGEESDFDQNGVVKSHFELYLDAMEQAGADTKPICNFLQLLKQGNDFDLAFENAYIPEAAKDFVKSTFEVIHTGQPHLQAACFTFGREDLIPSMFHQIVNDFNSEDPDAVSIFKYYLDRHIEVDGDSHSHLALDMIAELCGEDINYWNEAALAAKETLKQRINLWNAASEKILSSKLTVA